MICSEQVEALACSFPEFVYQKLLAFNYIEIDTPVTFVRKNKTRVIPKKTESDEDDVKISYHFILEIGGVPVMDHRFVCNQILHEYRTDIAQLRKTKTLDHLSDAQLNCPVWGMDPVNHGNQPFATLLSRKCRTDALPVLECRIAFQHREQVGIKRFEKWPGIEGSHIQTKLWLLYQVFGISFVWFLFVFCLTCVLICVAYQSSYTTPTGYISKYSDSMRASMNSFLSKTPQNRTVVSHHAVSQGGAGMKRRHPPFDGSALPQWIQSVLHKNGGFRSNSTMSCIEKYTRWLSGLLSGRTLVVEHVTHMYCPFMLCQETLKVHESNGTIVGVDPKEPHTIYVRCSYCKNRPSVTNDSMQLLGNAWLILTEELLMEVVNPGMSCMLNAYMCDLLL